MKTKLFLALVLFFIVSTCWCSADAAPDISVGEKQGSPEETLSIPVDFVADDSSTHIQFDLFYDSSVLTPGTPSAGDAVNGHVVDSNVVGSGHLRLVVYSLSNALLGSGRLMDLSFSIASDAPAGAYPLNLSSVIISNPTGQSITPTLLNDGSIEVIEETVMQIPMIGPFGIFLLIILIAWTAVTALKNPNSLSYRMLVLFVLFNFTMCSLGILPALAAIPGDCDDDGDIDLNDMLLTVNVILERSTAPGDPDCNTDGNVNVLDLPCQSINIGNSPPDLIPPGDRELMTDTDFLSTLFAIDPDPGDELTFSLPTAPSGMTCDSATGNLVWNPLVADIGEHSITVRVTDREGLSDSETFDINVYQSIPIGNENSAPDLSPITDQELTVGDSLSIVATATDPDAGDILTFSLPRGPAGMSIGSLSGQIQWSPDADQTGSHDVTVMVTDSGGLADAEAFSVTVRAQNRAPLANDDIYVARMGETLTFPATGVLENDTDLDGDPLQASLVQEPGKGALNLNPDGSFDYTPTTPQVIGNIQEVNQAMWLRPYKRASDRMPPYEYSYGADGDLNTSWLADADVDSFTYYLNFDGELRPTVKELRLYGNRGDIANGHDIYSGHFRLLDNNSVLLYESEELDFTSPDRDIVFPIPGSPISDVYRVEFVFSEFENKGNTTEPLPQPGFSELEVISDQEVLDVEKEWEYTSSLIEPERLKVIMTPLVGDINGDGMPDIVFVTYRSSSYGILRAVSGNNGSEIFVADDISNPAQEDDRLTDSTSLAMGDIDHDGYPEILGFYGNYIKAFQYDIDSGEIVREWTSEQIPNPRDGGMSIADIDADGIPEIIAGSRSELTVINNDGSIRWQAPLYNNGGYRMKFPFAVDLDLDGTMEILSGQMAYTASGEMYWPTPDSSLVDGNNAVGNFDNDPYPEIVLVTTYFGAPVVHLLEHDGTIKWGRVGCDGLGTPTVADFDGDGFPEIGVAGKHRYTVIDTDGTVLWERKIQDITSFHTGSSVFDFDGDGSAEVVFSDELDLIIFRGSDGAILFRTPIGSGTRWEYPVVADVDADGNAEIVVVRNQYELEVHEKDGLHVFGGPDNDWVPTRKIWNQHAYHITNVNDDLTIPAVQQYNWLTSGLNNFRANVPYMDEDGSKDQFTYKADDGLLDSNEATVFIDIQPANAIPVIVSQPEENATAGFGYTYWVVSQDQDNDPLTYSLPSAPAGMSIDPVIGRIDWSPDNSDLGDHPVMISVSDNKGGVAVQNFTLTVGVPVTVPDLIGETEAAAETLIDSADLDVGAITEGFHISIPAGLVAHQSPPAGSAAEPDSDVDIILSLGSAPEDVDDDGDGLTENQGDCNDADNTVYPGADDPSGDGIDQDCDGLDGNLPISEIIIIPGSDTLLAGDTVDATAIAVFDDGTSQQITSLATWNSLAPALASVDGSGQISAIDGGSATIEASLKGVTGSAVFDIHDVTAGDATPPTAIITTPEASSTITEPMDITGTAFDDNLLKYTLSYALAGETDLTLIHTGTAPVADDVLGQFDPTLLLNDLYTLRLTVYDTGGNVTISEQVYQVDENLKVGLFTLTFIDLDIPMAGIPIQVLRTYDSRDKSKGDFGVGWQLDIQTFRCTSNRILGTGWQVLKSGLAYQMFSTDFQKVSITLPDGQVEEFDMKISPNPSVIVPFSSVNASFTPRPGTNGKLQCLDDTALLVIGAQPGEVTLTDFGSNTFDPQNFRYTSLSGMQYVINKTDGVKSITEPNGNTLTIGPDGITHSSGKSVVFARDALDRITLITDPNGNVQTYSYDGNGNLHSHTDAETNTTRFFYNYQHGLLRIEDPLGRPVARSEYDDAGRLVASIDALGNRIEYTHNIGTRQEVVRDRLNGITVYEYDENGNVVSETDPMGYTKTYIYDANGNTTSMTDPMGNVTTYTYDANNLMLSETDPMGNTTFYTYNSLGQVLTQTDPKGGVVTNTYDGAGNKLSTMDQKGNSKYFTYDAGGNLLTEKDKLDHVTSYAYDAFGNQNGITNALGFVTSLTYDSNGQQTLKSKTRTTPTGPETFTTQYQYDKTGKTVKVIDPLGNFTATGYDATGKKAYSDDKNGNRTSYEYDPAGNLTKTTFPDGTFESSTYDATGNRVTRVNRKGELSSFTYDALSRQISVTYPGGRTISTTYDSTGNETTKTNALGNTVLYGYDAAGRNTIMTDPLGGVINWSYDANGNTISTTDVNGNTTTFEYDQANRKVKTLFSDGTSTVQACDAKGKVISVTDQAGILTSYEYDKLGRLVKVTDGNRAETIYTYDEVGNLISRTDANGHVTLNQYDHLSRVVKKILPLGMYETYAYDNNGNLIQKTDFNGDTTNYAFDVNNQLITETLPDGSLITYTYTATGDRESVIDHRGTTSYAYDELNQLIQVANPDGTFISYTYNGGNRSSLTTPSGTTTYTYDANNRLETVTSPDSGVTSYTYHPTGSRASVTYPNGTATTYTYDALNRLVHQETQKSDTTLISSYDYTLGTAGNKVQIVENTGRIIDYTYDNGYRLTEEDITDPLLGSQTISYTYDDMGNRLSKTDPAGSIIYDYDDNDRLLTETGPSDTRSYTYNSNGNTISSTAISSSIYSYDSKDRLVSVNSSGNTISYDYDTDGIRVQSTINGEITKFLADKKRQYAQVLETRAGDDSLIASYTYGDDLIAQKKDSQVSFYAYDGHGSTRHLLDQTENITDTYVYDAFGVELNRTGATENNYLYAGEQYDLDLDGYYLRARYYTQNTGRFMTTDPWQGTLRDPVSLHKYLYARNNPVDFIDPSGKSPLAEVLIVILVTAILASVPTISPKKSIEDAGLYYIPTKNGSGYRRIEVGKPVRDVIFDAAGENKPYSHWEEFKKIVGKFYDAVDHRKNYSVQCNDMSQIIDKFDGTFHRETGVGDSPTTNKSNFEYFSLKSYDWNAKHYSTILHIKGSEAPLIVFDPIGITHTGQWDNADLGFKRYFIWTWDEYSARILPHYGIDDYMN